MINKCVISSFMNYTKNNTSYSEDQLEQIEYSLTVIITEIEKILLLFIIFTLFHKTYDFLFAVITLILIRPYTGGLHFKTFWGCFGFSLIIFSLSIFLLVNINLNIVLLIILFLFSIISFILLAPIPSKTRPKYSKEKRLQFKLISIIMTIIFFGIFIFTYGKNPYSIQAIWIITLQSIQLIIAKGVQVYESNNKKHL